MLNKKISQKREQQMGKQIGGKSHIASGALWFQKGDISNEHIIIEDKFTHKDKFTLTLDIINKIEKEGKKENKLPFVTVGFHTHKFSVAVINSKYCSMDNIKKMPELYYGTTGKSIQLFYSPLYFSHIHAEDPISLLAKLDIGGQIFYIIEWETLIENISSFLYL